MPKPAGVCRRSGTGCARSEEDNGLIMNQFRIWVNWFWYGWAIGLVLSLALIIAIAPAPYFHDFGEWLYQGKILALKITDSAAVAGFTVAPYPVPNSLAPVLLALLCLVLAPMVAGKVFLILLLAGWIWILWRFTCRFTLAENRGVILVLLVAVIALASFFWYGFISYQLGLLLWFAFLTNFNERCSNNWIAGFGVALFMSHAMVFLTWVPLVVLLILASQPRQWRILLALAPSGVLVLWFMLGRRLTGFDPPVADARMSGIAEILLYKFGSPLLLGGFRNFLLPDGTSLFESQVWLYRLGAITNFLVVALLGVYILQVFLKPNAGDNRNDASNLISAPLEQSLRWFGWTLIAAYLIAPYNFFGLINPGGRLLLPLLAVGLVLADRRILRWAQWAAIPAALGATLSVAAYGILMYRAGTEDLLTHAEIPSTAGPPSDSVFAFNDWLYRNTRYKYFNYRIFVLAERFAQLRASQFPGLAFRTGPITDYHSRP